MTDDQFLTLAGLLVEIRDAVLALTVEEPEAEGCTHPEDKRVSFATPNNPTHWVCAVCRYENVGVTTN